MYSSTARAFPSPYSEACSTFRTAVWDFPAARTGLGAVPFIGNDNSALVPSGLIRKLLFEHIPACIQHGFCHVGLGELAAVHIADDNSPVVSGNSRRRNMEGVFASVFHFGVDCLHAFFVSGTLRYRKLVLKAAIPAFVLDFYAIGKRGNVLQTEVYADSNIRSLRQIFNFGLEGYKPVTLRILNKGSGLEPLVEIPVPPEAVSPLPVGNSVSFELDSTADKRNPAKTLSHASELRAFLVGITGLHELFADYVAGIGMNADFTPEVFCGVHKVKMGWPEIDARTLKLDTEIPDHVDLPLVVA